MKHRNNLVLILAASVAAAGIAGFLFGTETGRKTIKRLTQKQKLLVQNAADLKAEGKKKLAQLKEQVERKAVPAQPEL